MAITVQHTPDMNALFQAGYTAGAGLFRQQQRELAQRERMQMRSIEANFISQQMAQANRLELADMRGRQQFMADQQHNAARMQFANLEWNRRADLAHQQQAFQRQMQDIDFQQRQDIARFEFEERQNLAELQNLNAIDRDIAQFQLGDASDRMMSVRKMLQDGMTFETQREADAWDKFQESWKTVVQDASLDPKRKASALFELSRRVPFPKQQEVSIQDIIDQRSGFKDDPISGKRFMILQSGEDRYQAIEVEQKEIGSLQDQVMASPELYEKFAKIASDALTTKGADGAGDKKPNASQIREFVDEMLGKKPEAAPPEPVAPPQTPDYMAPDWYDALPMGATYVDPADGQTKRKT